MKKSEIEETHVYNILPTASIQIELMTVTHDEWILQKKIETARKCVICKGRRNQLASTLLI